jgi:hypothetical protein
LVALVAIGAVAAGVGLLFPLTWPS